MGTVFRFMWVQRFALRLGSISTMLKNTSCGIIITDLNMYAADLGYTVPRIIFRST